MPGVKLLISADTGIRAREALLLARERGIITAVDGKEIGPHSPLDDILTQFAPGRTVALDVLRDGKKIALTLTLGTRPASVQ